MDRSLFTSFGLRENPFGVNPNPKHIFLTRQTQKAFDDMAAGIRSRQGLILLTGDVGTGKTTLINSLLGWLEGEGTPTALVVNSHLEANELFELMLDDFGVSSHGQGGSAFARLNAWLLELHRSGRTAVLIIDEAQGLPPYTLEEIRLLLNLETPIGKLLQVVLSGQPEFEQKLRRTELRQIHQRVAIRCRTAPMTAEETRACIRQRLRSAGAEDDSIFSVEAMDTAFFYSRGIPRIINLLCEHALLKALATGTRPVTASMIEDASRELQFDLDRPVPAFRTEEVGLPRANLIPMQPAPSKPPLAFAAAAGASADRHADLKNVAMRRPPEPHVVTVMHTQNVQANAQHGGNASHMGFVDVGQIISELGRTAALTAPVRINSAGAARNSRPAAVATRKLNRQWTKLTAASSAFGAKWTATVVPQINASGSWIRSYGHRLSDRCVAKASLIYASPTWIRSYGQQLSKQCVAKVSLICASASSASPAFARTASSLIFWLKTPLRIGHVVRGNPDMHLHDEDSGRFSALTVKLWDKAEPILRWLQAPARPAHRR
jgi:general secretion pathway protein A